jgi:hypothetical protein
MWTDVDEETEVWDPPYRRSHNLGEVDPVALLNSIPGANVVLAYLKSQVQDSAKRAVKPYILGAYVLSGVALLLSVAALIKR